MFKRDRDLIISSGFFRDLTKESNSFYLKDSEFKIWTAFSYPNYDNDDNPYAKIVVDYKTSLEEGEGGPKGELALVECKESFSELWTDDMRKNAAGRIYCPKFEDHHRMMANYNYDRRAWLRVSVHVCDPE